MVRMVTGRCVVRQLNGHIDGRQIKTLEVEDARQARGTPISSERNRKSERGARTVSNGLNSGRGGEYVICARCQYRVHIAAPFGQNDHGGSDLERSDFRPTAERHDRIEGRLL